MARNKRFTFVMYVGIALLLYVQILTLFVKSPLLLGKPIYFLIVSFIGLIVVIALVLKFFGHFFSKASKALFFAVLVVITFIPRLFWVICINSKPVSDFQLYQQYAASASHGILNVFDPTYAVFPFKFGYPLILSLLYRITGVSLLAAKLLNVGLSILTALLIYWVAEKVVSERSGRLASILFALWPAQIMFNSVPGSEHVFVPLLVLSFGLVVMLERKMERGIAAYIYGAVIGAILAVANFIKPMSIVFFPVYFIYLFVFVKREKPFVLDIFSKLKVFSLTAISFIACFMLICYPLSKTIGVSIWRSSSGFSMLIGTNFETSGMYSTEDAKIVRKYNFDYDQVHKESARIAVRRIISHPVQFLIMIEQKYICQWADDSFGLYWGIAGLEKPNGISDFVIDHHELILLPVQLYYIIVLIFAAAGLLYSIKKSRYKVLIPLLVFLILFAAHTFLEVQPRYHYPAVPFLMIIAGYGLEWFGQRVAPDHFEIPADYAEDKKC